MEDTKLLNQIRKAKTAFGTKCSKYIGAMTVEFIRLALREYNIAVSTRDVFIKGVPAEIDLLIPREGTVPTHGILYEAEDVLIALEIKNRGAFGEGTVTNIRKNFLAIQQKNKNILCFYVTLQEQKGYKWAVTEMNLGFPAYTLFLRSGSGKNERYESTGDWERLISHISSVYGETSKI